MCPLHDDFIHAFAVQEIQLCFCVHVVIMSVIPLMSRQESDRGDAFNPVEVPSKRAEQPPEAPGAGATGGAPQSPFPHFVAAAVAAREVVEGDTRVTVFAPNAPPSGVWDVEIQLALGRPAPGELPDFQIKHVDFRAGMDEVREHEFIEHLLPILHTGLTHANMWKRSADTRAMSEKFHSANTAGVVVVLITTLVLVAAMIFACISGSDDPSGGVSLWLALTGAAVVLFLCGCFAVYKLLARVGAVTEEWLTRVSMTVARDITTGVTGLRLLTAGGYIALGEPEWRPKRKCGCIRDIHFVSAKGPCLRLARLNSRDFAVMRIHRQQHADDVPLAVQVATYAADGEDPAMGSVYT